MMKRKLSKSKSIFLWTSVIPVFALYLFVCILPIFTAVRESFYGGNQFGVHTPLANFYDNYVEIFHDPLFWASFRNDMIISFAKEAIIIAIVVFFSIAMTRLQLRSLESGFYRYVFYIPNVLSVIVITQFWGEFFKAGGLFNTIFNSNVDLMTKEPLAVVIFIASWCGIGYFMLILISSINNIPKELFEAAEIDGAGQVKQLFSVTLPQIKPQIIFMAVNILSSSLAANMNIILPLNGGGGQKQSFVMGMFVYYYGKSSATELRLGYANAGAVVLMFISFVLCFTLNKLLARGDRADEK